MIVEASAANAVHSADLAATVKAVAGGHARKVPGRRGIAHKATDLSVTVDRAVVAVEADMAIRAVAAASFDPHPRYCRM